MLWYTHVTFAALVFLVLKIPLQWPWLALPVCMLAAAIPDIDHPDSKISNRFRFASRITELFFSHRGIIHTIFAAVAFSVVVMAICLSTGISTGYTYAFLAGYISHLMMDSLNPAGIAWLHPFSKARARSVIRAGGVGELLILITISGLIALNVMKVFL